MLKMSVGEKEKTNNTQDLPPKKQADIESAQISEPKLETKNKKQNNKNKKSTQNKKENAQNAVVIEEKDSKETAEPKPEVEKKAPAEKVDIDSVINEVEKQINSDLKKQNPDTEFKVAKQGPSIKKQIFKTIENVFFIFIILIALAFTIFTISNVDNSKISYGVSILDIDVSNMTKEEAIEKVTNQITHDLSNNNIMLKHNDFETSIEPSQLETTFNVESAVDAAFEVGSGNNAITNSFKKIALIVNPTSITPEITINEEQLSTTLSDISTQLPDAVIQSTYYIEGENLIITPGQSGVIIDIEKMSETIKNKLNNLSYINTPIEIATISQEPEQPNIDDIYNEIHKEATDAYYTTDPYVVYPEQNGLDFAISVDEAKQMLATAETECVIPLKTLYPSVTTNMIGMEAFPDLLSSFSTRYATSNRDRTTNLILAANKINGTVLLPGETFSYNTVVGERTIAAGYKEAAIYQDGEVVDGLGGGICQISTTLYNAALYANLEIVERRNHQFVTSYADAGRDATVVYGSQDFKFKNSRGYAIKIVCSVENGIAKFDIYGVREPTDLEVVITSKVTKRTATSISSVTYKTLKQNGQVVSSEVLSRDTYKVH